VNYLEPGDFPRTVSGVTYQYNEAAWNFTNINQNKKSGLNIFNNTFRGLLEYLPAGYSAEDKQTKYPVIIFFHGGGSRGDGSARQLCRLFKDRGDDMATHKSIPGRVARQELPLTQQYEGKTYKFIVISPQFFKYDRPLDESAPADYPSAPHVEAMINYVVQHYNVDTNRIYLTGYSNGANMIVEYAASSVARAKRVAAIMPVSNCTFLNSVRNANANLKPANITNGKLPVWFVQCITDVPCGLAPAQEWYNVLKNTAGSVTPRFTMLRDNQSDPLYQCSDTLLHDAWSRAYDPIFRKSFVNGNGVNDNINLNMCEWFIRQSREKTTQPPPPPPPKDPGFTGRVKNGHVELEWETNGNVTNPIFLIQRSGPDKKFIDLGKFESKKDWPELPHHFDDPSPLTDISHYRLLILDSTGKIASSATTAVVNAVKTRSQFVASPNPFTTTVSAYLSLDKAQEVVFSLADLNGKLIRVVKGFHPKGSSIVSIPSADLPSGIYLLKATGSTFRDAQKIIRK
jgi:predicted esterase